MTSVFFLTAARSEGSICVLVDLGEIYRLVQAVLLDYRGNPVLGGLDEVESAAAGGAELGDHLLVVAEGHLDLDPRLGGEFIDKFLGGVAGPGHDPENLVFRGGFLRPHGEKYPDAQQQGSR